MGRNDKIASATVQLSSPNGPLNDANENAKVNDTCKELKTLLDGGTNPADIPDTLLAKLLKARLLALKAEGIEAKNAAKAAKQEIVEAAVTPADPADAAKSKPGKKDDKEKEKEKERAKSPVKKPTKGATSKQESSSRPESAAVAQESSIRKTKLRERGVVKADVKPTAIGDEPENGPDAYYLLREFAGPSFFTTFMEEHGVQVNLILYLSSGDGHEASNVELVSASGAAFRSLRKTAQKSTDSSLWKQVAFHTTVIPAETSQLFDHVAQTIYAQLKIHEKYDEYYVQDRTIIIPEVPDARFIETARYFAHLLRGLPEEWMANNVDVLLALMLEQVTRTSGEEALVVEDPAAVTGAAAAPPPPPMTALPDKAEEITFLKQYFEHATKALASTGAESAAGIGDAVNRLAVSLDEELNSLLICTSDIHAQIGKAVRAPSIVGINMNTLLAQLRSRFAAGRAMDCMRAMMERGIMEPPSSSSAMGGGREQLVCASKLQTLTSAVRGGTTESGLRVLHQDEFRALVGEQGTEQGAVDGMAEWRWVERLDEATFAQVLENALTTAPSVKAKFSDQVIGFDEEVEFLYPDGGSYVKSHRVSSNNQLIDTSASIVWSRNMLSFRHAQPLDSEHSTASVPKSSTLSVTFGDEICFSFALGDGNGGTLQAQVSTANGLVIRWNEDGTITQRYCDSAAAAAASQPAKPLLGHGVAGSSAENGRAVRPDGTVIRYLRSSETQILFPKGNVSTCSASGVWTSVNEHGQVITTANDAEAPAFPTSTMLVTEERDLTSRSIVMTRADMVNVVRKADGDVFTKHADGTEIAVTNGGAAISVDMKGFAQIKLSLGEDAPGTTSSVTFDKGSVCECAKDNGRVEFRIRKGDDELTVSSDGKATLKPSHRPITAKGGVGVYDIDWAKGTLQTEDEDGVRYELQDGGHCIVKPASNRNGKNAASEPDQPAKAKAINISRGKSAVVRETLLRASLPQRPRNAPRLFVLHSDGSGHELLRDADVADYFQDAIRKAAAGVKIVEEPLVDSTDSVGVTVIVGRPSGEFANTQSGVLYRQLIRHPLLSKSTVASFVNEYSDLESKVSESVARTRSSPAVSVESERVAAELVDRLASTAPASAELAQYGLSRSETEMRIKLRYGLHEDSIVNYPKSDRDSREGGGPGARVPSTAKSMRSFSSSQPAKDGTVTTARRKRRSLHNMLHDTAVPPYFDSPEGQAEAAKLAASPPVAAPAATPEQADMPEPVVQPEVPPPAPEPPQQPRQKSVAPPPSSQLRPDSPLKTDVLGQPRRGKLLVPVVLRSSRQSAVPNSAYLAVEASARRQIKTSSTAGLKDVAALDSLGTFNIYPSRINFGRVRVSGDATASLQLVNVGNCVARFKVKLEKGSCIEAKFTPGPVAPGMKVELKLRFTPRGLTSPGDQRVTEELRVITEAHIFTVPCVAGK
ncbi:Sperm-associated antigen 17 [Geranomyces variabilis]|uniref:Sperm-associated antigen 17 n=1 Tax=Geranomyces variabilis TaxID=109894 RepID=A0AAD5TDQ6_9FUNG|nr:Sperm-associated antigen 17 [Geranomyces variabilis]